MAAASRGLLLLDVPKVRTHRDRSASDDVDRGCRPACAFDWPCTTMTSPATTSTARATRVLTPSAVSATSSRSVDVSATGSETVNENRGAAGDTLTRWIVCQPSRVVRSSTASTDGSVAPPLTGTDTLVAVRPGRGTTCRD